MKNTTQKRYTKTAATLVALTLVLSVFGPIGTVAAVDGITVSQQADSTTVAPGDMITFTTEVGVNDAQIQAYSIGLQTDLPDGWTVTNRANGANMGAGPDGWLWFNAVGVSGSDTVQYTVAVPDDAATGDYDVDVTASTEDGESTTDTTTVSVATEQPNAAPDADAGGDQTVDEGDTVTLDASDSSDDDGDALTYAWTQTGGPSVSLSDATAASPTFAAPGVDEETTMTFEVDVADGNGGADTDSVSVTVQPVEPSNEVPTASITGPTAAQTGETLTFEADASDDGSIESYAWDLGDGTTASGESVSHAYTSVGDYAVELTVTDDDGATATATQTVSVSEAPPVNSAPDADAGDDQTVTAGDSVTLDAASGSSDADGDTLTYAWTQTGGSSVDLSGADSATPSFTAPDVGEATTMTFEVSVADGNGGADTDSVSVTVEPDESAEPDDPDETDPATTVSLSPEDDLLGVNQTGSYDLVVDPAAGGVGAYSITVSLSDSSVGTITDVELAGDGSISDVQVAEDGSSVTIEAVLVDTNDTGAVTLGTVSVQGVAEGETDLVLDVETLGTEAGEAYDVTEVDGATLTVSTLVVGDSDGPAIDADGDGVHEDVNGDGVVDVLDVQTLFADRNGPTTTQNPDAFDFNGDGQFDVLDVQWLYYNEVA